MNFLKNLIIISAVPLWIINSFGWIVSFVWLAILGNYWFLLGSGIAAMFLSSYAFAFAMLPSTGVTLLAMKMFEKKQKLIGIILMYISTILLIAVFAFWVFFIYLTGSVNIQAESHVFPVLLWCFAVSVAPIQYMASKEPRDAIGTTVMIISAILKIVALDPVNILVV